MIGPSDNYRSGRKNQYRREVWNALESTAHLRRIPKYQRRVLILDEWMAHESQFLVRRGYNPKHITAVNFSTATAARITMSLRGLGIDGVTAKGGDVSEVWERYADKGIRFDAIHLDFCGNVERKVIECLEGFNGCAALGPVAVAVNLLRGREHSPRWRGAVSSIQRTDATPDHAKNYTRRLLALGSLTSCHWTDPFRVLCKQHLLLARTAIYKSTNGQTMLWFAGELRSHSDALRDSGHTDWIRKVASRRSAPGMFVPEAWALPECVKALADGSKSARDILTLLQSYITDDRTEALITPSATFAARLDSVMERTRNEVSGFSDMERREREDPRRQFPIRLGGGIPNAS